MHKHKPTSVKDFSVLINSGNSTTKENFEAVVKEKLKELQHSAQDSVSKIYDDMCVAMTHAMEVTLPTVPKQHRVKRKVSDRTKALCE